MEKKVLIAYYSWSSNTRKIAQYINETIDATVFEIEPKDPYTSNYNAVVDQAKKEIKEAFKPKLKKNLDSIDQYDIIFVGSPNWWSTIAPPVTTFLSEFNFSNKIIIPFVTHGGGGEANMIKDISTLCPGTTILDGFVAYGAGSGSVKNDVKQWLLNLKMI